MYFWRCSPRSLDTFNFKARRDGKRYLLSSSKSFHFLSLYNRCRTSVQTESDSSRMFDYFDTLLLFSLLSTDNCPQALTDLFKTQMTSHPDREDMINFALKHKKLSSRYLQSLTRLAQQCLFTSNDVLRSVGALIYKNLFKSVHSSRTVCFFSLPEILLCFRTSSNLCSPTFRLPKLKLKSF